MITKPPRGQFVTSVAKQDVPLEDIMAVAHGSAGRFEDSPKIVLCSPRDYAHGQQSVRSGLFKSGNK